jgi:hypothetical protein
MRSVRTQTAAITGRVTDTANAGNVAGRESIARALPLYRPDNPECRVRRTLASTYSHCVTAAIALLKLKAYRPFGGMAPFIKFI